MMWCPYCPETFFPHEGLPAPRERLNDHIQQMHADEVSR